MENLHREFVRLGQMRHKLKNKLLYLLPKIYENGIYKKYAKNIIEYAAIYGDLSKTSVIKRLRLEKNLQNKPHLKEAIKTAGVNKVALIAKIATPETEKILAEKIMNMSKSAVEVFSREYRVGQKMKEEQAENLFNQSHQIQSNFENLPCRAVPQKLKLELSENMTFLFLKLKRKLGKNLSNREVMKIILKMADEKLFPHKKQPTEAEKDTKNVTGDTFPIPKNKTKITRYIKASIRHQIIARSHHQCEYPHCNKPAVEFHHTERFSQTHLHKNIIHFCHEHHEIAHNGLIKNERKEPEKWQLQLYTVPNLADIQYQNYHKGP